MANSIIRRGILNNAHGIAKHVRAGFNSYASDLSYGLKVAHAENCFNDEAIKIMGEFTDAPNRDFFQIEILNHVTGKREGRKSFETRRKANKWLKENAEKVGYDFCLKGDMSIEFCRLY